MKTKFAWVFLLAIAPSAVPTRSQAQDSKADDGAVIEKGDKAALQKMYMDYLAEEGYRPKVDEDGDVVFKAEGGNYFIRIDEDEPTYFELVYPNFWEIEDEDERTRAYVAASATCLGVKSTKVYVVEDNVWAGVELFLPEPGDFKKLFHRCLNALNNGRDAFAERMSAGAPGL